jgi:hypothetical protein
MLPGKIIQKGNGLGPVHSSTGPVEMLSRVQKLYKTGHVAESQRVQCSLCTEPKPYPIQKNKAVKLCLVAPLTLSKPSPIVLSNL